MLHNKKGGYNSIPLTNALWVPEQYKQIVHDNEKAEMSICTSVTIHSQASIIIKSKKNSRRDVPKLPVSNICFEESLINMCFNNQPAALYFQY